MKKILVNTFQKKNLEKVKNFKL